MLSKVMASSGYYHTLGHLKEPFTLASQLAVSRIKQLFCQRQDREDCDWEGRGGTDNVAKHCCCQGIGGSLAILGKRVPAIKSFLKLIIKPKVGKQAQPKNEHNELTTLFGLIIIIIASSHF